MPASAKQGANLKPGSVTSAAAKLASRQSDEALMEVWVDAKFVDVSVYSISIHLCVYTYIYLGLRVNP